MAPNPIVADAERFVIPSPRSRATWRMAAVAAELHRVAGERDAAKERAAAAAEVSRMLFAELREARLEIDRLRTRKAKA